MKKITSVLLALVILVMAVAMPASAFFKQETDKTLRFNENGKFRILHICDIQNGPFLKLANIEFLKDAIEETQPDLIVLGGDNVNGGATYGIAAIGIDRFMSIFESYGIPVAAVLGNHDDEGLSTREFHFKCYEKYDCFVGCAGEDLTGCGTYNLPIYANQGDKVLFNLWMFDSLSYNEPAEFPHKEGFMENDLKGYACVHKDQIDWYVETSNELKAANGGKVVPSMAFQHIVVPEIYDALVKVPEGTAGSVGGYKLPAGATGEMDESPCPPQYSNGQFDAMRKQGDVVAMFFGHDHTNTYVVNHKGIDLVNTPGQGFGSYGNDNRGVRIIDLDVKNLKTYDTEILYWREYYDADNDVMMQYRFIINGNEFSTAEKFDAFIGYVKEYFNRLLSSMF